VLSSDSGSHTDPWVAPMKEDIKQPIHRMNSLLGI
jgi:hypothetical protein